MKLWNGKLWGTRYRWRRRKSCGTSLMQLILQRNWQQVLIRAALVPEERRWSQVMEWDGIAWHVNALHLACALDPPIQVIQQLLETESAATLLVRATQQYRHYRNPTHASMTFHPSIGQEWFPLHIACWYRASLAVLQALVNEYPAAARAGTILPVFICCAAPPLQPPLPLPNAIIPTRCECSALQALKLLLQFYPQAIHCRYHNRTLEEYVNDTLDDAHEKTECLRELQEHMPLDTTSSTTPSKETTGSTSVSSDTLSEKTLVPGEIICDFLERRTQQQIPLYQLLLSKDWEGAAHLVISEPLYAAEWHYSIGPRGLKKNLPISIACREGAPQALVELLLEAFPAAMTSRDLTGAVPLMEACRSHQGAVEVMVRHHPAGTKIKNHKGRLPLHVACSNPRSSFRVIYTLLKAFPGSICALDDYGLTPCDYAKQNEGLCRNIVSLLERLHVVMKRVNHKVEAEELVSFD